MISSEEKGKGNEGVQKPAVPSTSLPKGGGAIRGMGEKFAANPVTGTGSMTVPIATSPGRSGFGPQLSLTYDSGSGNGPFGFGWNLSIPAITRKTDKGLPQYRDAEDSDVFILSGAEDLVPEFEKDATGNWIIEDGKPVIHENQRTVDGITYAVRRYRPRIEGLFACIERWTNLDNLSDVHWRSISRDNVLTLYGKNDESRIADLEDPTRIFSWLTCETRDDKGNAIVYEYKSEDGARVDLTKAHERNRGERDDPRRKTNRYLKHILYGNPTPLLDDEGHRPPFLTDAQVGSAEWLFEVVFDYGEHDTDAPKPDDPGEWIFRDDPFSSYRAGFEVRTTRLCQRVLMFHHFDGEEGVGKDCLVRSTDFTYSHEEDSDHARNPVYTFLRAITQSGHKRIDDGYLKSSLPPIEFEYTQPNVQDTVEEVDSASLENLPSGVDGATYQWTDLHGEGIPGILTEQGNAWFYKRNLSPIGKKQVELAPLERVAVKPNLALAGGAQFMDLAGDGQPDLVVLEGSTPGFYEHDGAEGWQSFRPFTSRLNRDTRDPNLKFVDLDGDGHADVLITENEAFVWHASLAEAGFGPARRVHQALDEEKGPRLVFADGTQSIYLADLSGDGLTDLVRIRNGEVCYWPNLGYGRFGAKVTMDHSPQLDHPDQFDHQRIRLADIDGTGTTDIIYLHRDGVRLYFNQSGNGWSEPHVLGVFPPLDDLVNIVPTDLLGNGTACLVWSSPLGGDAWRPMRYVNLMGGQKPHLLIKTVNNLGAETHVQYAPSTKFYLQDKRDGKPWITRLPFPVHVVERVETFDHISRNHFVTRYAYHHGYFDGEEREFRGFGMVEQWDTEEFAVLNDSDSLAPSGGEGWGEGASNIDLASHVPPVHTKTWFHTGVYRGRDHVSDFFAGLLDGNDAGEYYREPGLTDALARELLLEDTVLPAGLTVEEAHEACRALKGAMLRQEVYALDGSDKEDLPYTVTEQNFTIRVLQGRGDNRHGVFFTHPREAITYHYERNPADPRIQHALTLEVDEFGNVLKEAAVGYGRRPGQSPLPGDDQQKQEQTLVTYTENRLTNAIDDGAAYPDDYRTPLPCATRTYELTGYTPTGAAGRFRSSDFVRPDLAYPDGMKLVHVFDEEIQYEDRPTGGKQRRLIEHVRTLYRKDDLTGPLALGDLQPLALPFESYTLALTPGLVQKVYIDSGKSTPAEFETMAVGAGGYVHSEGDANWWIPAGQIFYSPEEAHTPAQELAFARQHFFLPHRFRDPFGETTTVRYDAYDLLLLETEDPLHNKVTAGERDEAGNITPRYNYRVLQPELLTDPNRNRSFVAFDALGLVVGTAVRGKVGEDLGDSFDSFEADLEQAAIDAFFDSPDPRALAPNLLGTATTRIVYDVNRYSRTGDPDQPPFAATIARETHVSDPVPEDGLKTQVSFSYSDGFGRVIQNKIQAEPGPLEEGGPIVDPRWVGSGWTIFNNKGKPVRQYEPFFSTLDEKRHRFEFARQEGVSPIFFYDPVERVVATLHPNHTYEKVVFDPWRQETWDVNDTVLVADPKDDPDVGGFFRRLPEDDYLPTWHEARKNGQRGAAEQAAATKAAAHADTPSVVHFDTLGRPFLTVADNGAGEKYETRVKLDIEGNPLVTTDARGNAVETNAFNLLGQNIYRHSVDAGERWMLGNVVGNPIRAWDGRGHQIRTSYDELQRPTHRFVKRDNSPELLGERTVYGESHSSPAAFNLRGQPYQQFDGAGVVTYAAYDFKGNLIQSSRQLAQNYQNTVDWWVLSNLTDVQDIANAAAPLLESEIFTSSTAYDALNRAISLTTPDNSETRPVYNEANLLEKVEVRLRGAPNGTPFVNDIDYDAKGRRTFIDYANGVHTAYDYDPKTFRLINIKTTRHSDNAVLQDLHYTYDPVGNITEIRDDAHQTIFFNQSVVSPHAEYLYDPLYRLIQAEGREHAGQGATVQRDHTEFPIMPLPHPNDAQAMRNYTEHYVYDEVGNILKMIHAANNANWTRCYEYEPTSNRLLSTSLPGDDPLGPFSAKYEHDANGNMTKMPHLPEIRWNFEDQMQRADLGGGGMVYFVYDAAGQRVRKVWEHSGYRDERIYLGNYEVWRRTIVATESLKDERETLHIFDDARRICMVETLTVENEIAVTTPTPRRRFQLDNHLGSVCVEVDGVGSVISYEEYHPYGTSAYRAMKSDVEVSAKRYRYTGKEKDEETKLYLMGARYYAAWLARWTTADPAGTVDGTNLYAHVRGSPVGLVDPSGTQSVEEFTKTGVYLHGSAEKFARSDYAAQNFTTSEEAYAFFHQAHHVREMEARETQHTAEKDLAKESGEAEPEPQPYDGTVEPEGRKKGHSSFSQFAGKPVNPFDFFSKKRGSRKENPYQAVDPFTGDVIYDPVEWWNRTDLQRAEICPECAGPPLYDLVRLPNHVWQKLPPEEKERIWKHSIQHTNGPPPAEIINPNPTAGISANVGITVGPIGQTVGVNLQFGEGITGVYLVLANPGAEVIGEGEPAGGFSFGGGVQVNIGEGYGEWYGPFSTVNGSYGPVGVSAYQSPGGGFQGFNGGYEGVGVGFAGGANFGASVQTEEYFLILGPW